MKMSEYKPILVLYMPIYRMPQSQLAELKRNISENEINYSILIVDCETPKAEIISVDKATVVEDIQKYIDLKLEEND